MNVQSKPVSDLRPVGCFCDIMAIPLGCLICTCPDCGAIGRFGVEIAHKEGCA